MNFFNLVVRAHFGLHFIPVFFRTKTTYFNTFLLKICVSFILLLKRILQYRSLIEEYAYNHIIAKCIQICEDVIRLKENILIFLAITAVKNFQNCSIYKLIYAQVWIKKNKMFKALNILISVLTSFKKVHINN